ncbi:hypothetical protein [Streptomyces sp. NPDC002889]|uniref:hypothetical protein n=1 Tax=Streptomyces sp. NPDC002889 TaxID=3364669 RepID=UPI0036CC7A5A
MRTGLGRLALTGVTLLTATATRPPGAAAGLHVGHPSGRGLSAVIRYTEYGIPHIVAKDYANLGFGAGGPPAVCSRRRLPDGTR